MHSCTGIPLILLFPGYPYRPDAAFNATVRSHALDFTVDHYRGAGLFTGMLADVTFDNIDRVELPGASHWSGAGDAATRDEIQGLTGGTITFRKVKFQSLLLPTGSAVRVEWYAASPTGIRMHVHYPHGLPVEAASVFTSGASSLAFQGSKVSGLDAVQTGDVDLATADAGAARIYVSGDMRLSISVTPRSVEDGKPAALEAEGNLPLLPASSVDFTDEAGSAIVGSDNVVQIVNADRPEPVLDRQTLHISNVRAGASITSIDIKDGINVAIRGTAGTLEIDGADVRPSPAEYLRAQKVLGTWFTTSLLIGTAALTVASRIRLVKLEEH